MARLEILGNQSRLSTKTRRASIDGREYIVAPLTMLVPGVLNGSQGALYYPPEEVAKNHDAWNGMPLVVRHPTINGTYVSARRPDVLQNYGIGWVYNSHIYKDKLKGEGWFDVEKTRKVDQSLLARLESGQPIEISTGLFTENTLADNGASHNGKPYAYVARNYKPDHLAILPDEQGACSVNDGCGINVNKQQEPNTHLVVNEWSDAAREASAKARAAKSIAKTSGTKDEKELGQYVARVSTVAHKASEDTATKRTKIAHQYAAISHSDAADAHRVAHESATTTSVKSAHLIAAQAHDRAAQEHLDKSRLLVNEYNTSAIDILVTNAKKPSKQLDMSPEKACQILKDGTVHGKPLTDSQKGMFGALCGERDKTNNQSNSLTGGDNTMDRTAKITYITANCDCWKGPKGKDALALLTDNEIDKIKEDIDRKAVLNTFATNVRAKFGDAILTANADEMEKGMIEKCKELMGTQAPVTPTTNTQPTGNRLTPEEQEDLAFARAEKMKQKASLIEKITANVSDSTVKQTKAQSLAKKSLADLQEIASLIPDAPTTNSNSNDPLGHLPILSPIYLGGAGGPPVLNRTNNTDGDKDLPVLPKVDWVAEQKLLNNKGREE